MSVFVQTQRKAIPKNAQTTAQLLAKESESSSVVSDSLRPHELYFFARILEWVAFPFSGGSSQPTDRTQVFCIAGELLTS